MKAQVTVEFLIILVVMMLLFSGVTMQLAKTSLKNTFQMQTLQAVSSANSSMLSAVSIISVQPQGAVKTIMLRAPVECNYSVQANKISLQCNGFSKQYDGMSIAETNKPVAYSCPSCSSNVIISNEQRGVRIERV